MFAERITSKSNSLTALWLRWVVANAFGEMIGLGATFAVGVLYFTLFGDQNTPGMLLVTFIVAVASGSIEATLVGLLQWRAMKAWFPAVPRKAWWLATLLGALFAYVLGYLPSTIMSIGSQAAQSSAVTEPPQWVILLLAADMGLVGGAVLSFAQWRVLRQSIQKAGIWVPANCLAWMVAMPVIFWGIDAAQKGQPIPQAVLLLASVLFVAGVLVGAIHGAFLVRLARENQTVLADTQ